jgi:hypothetical protein
LTRIKLGESTPIQWIPLQAVGARPVGLKDVQLGTEEEQAGAEKVDRRPFVQKYVRR